MQVGILRAREGDSWLGNGEYRNELVLLESLYTVAPRCKEIPYTGTSLLGMNLV